MYLILYGGSNEKTTFSTLLLKKQGENHYTMELERVGRDARIRVLLLGTGQMGAGITRLLLDKQGLEHKQRW